MEMTIEQALQKAVEAHKADKLQDAESLYRAILQAQPNHPDANHNLGVLAVSLNKTEASLPLFKIALEANPNQGQFWLSYLDALIREKQFDNARNLLEQAKKAGLAGEKVDAIEEHLAQFGDNFHDKASTLYKLSMAIELREMGKYHEAQEWLIHFLNHEQSNAEGWSLLSQVYLLDKRDIDAEKALAKAISINPNLPSANRNQARLLIKKSKPTEALEIAKIAYEQSSANPESWLVLAACLGANQKDEEALRLIERAMKAKSNYAEAFANRALVRLRAKNITSGIEDLEMALSLKPHFVQLWGLLGSLRYQSKNLVGAIEALKKANALEPTNVNYLADLGEFLRQDNQVAEAISVLQEAANLAPENANVWTNFGTALQQDGKIELAKLAYQKALAINPKSSEISNNLGALAREEENWEDAVLYFEQALSIQPRQLDFMMSLAASLIGLRNYKKAESFLKEVLEKDVLNINAIFLMSILEESYGDVKEAEKKLLTVIKSKPELSQPYINLTTILISSGRLIEAKEILSTGLKKIDKSHWRLASQLLVVCFLLRSYDEANNIQIKYSNSIDSVKKSENISRIFFNYLSALIASQVKIYDYSQSPSIESELVVIGDSHSLSPGNRQFTWIDGEVIASSRLIFGVKMFHLNCDISNNFIYYLSEQLSAACDGSHLLFTIGEIDCRPDEGIWKAFSNKPVNLLAIISNTVEKYLGCIGSKVESRKFASITIQGVPAPAYPLIGNRDPGDREAFLTMIKTVNEILKASVKLKGWFFLDVYAATIGVDGCSNFVWHLDQNHLSPLFYSEAKRYVM